MPPVSTSDLVQERLMQALAMHKAGRIADAARYYEQILALQPRHFDALQLLGAICTDSGQPERGMALIRRAISINARHAGAHCNLGNAFASQRQFAEAAASFGEALKLHPNLLEALQGASSACRELGRFEQALEYFDRLAELEPSSPGHHAQRARMLQNLRRLPEALAACDQAIALKPDYASAHMDRGSILADLGRREEACACYEQALALEPGFHEARNNLGIALQAMDRLDEAMAQFDRVLEQDPNFASVRNNRGALLQHRGDYAGALREYEAAWESQPGFAQALGNRGGVLAELQRYDEARACFDEAIALDPAVPNFLSNYAKMEFDLRRGDQALALYDRAIALKPTHVDAHFGKASVLLQRGQLAEGWLEFEWRQALKRNSLHQNLKQPLWQGEPGGTLFVYWEQGLGDSIQCARFVTMARDRCARVVFSVQDPLVPLLSQLAPAVEVVGADQVPFEHDWQIPLMSLPRVLGIGLHNIPAAQGYLGVDPQRREHFELLLGRPLRPRAGLVWRGNAVHQNDRRRSMSFEDVQPLLRDDVEYFCLQPLLPDRDMAALRKDGRVRFLRGALGDFADTAALADMMDLVITVDTSVAHLAGAIGKPTWLLLPYNPDWRWLLDREDTPWYESARLFRQDELHGWSDAVGKARVALDQLVERWAANRPNAP